MGYPELGSVSLAELESVRGKLGLVVERDLHFKAETTLSQYADEARKHGSIKRRLEPRKPFPRLALEIFEQQRDLGLEDRSNLGLGLANRLWRHARRERQQ